ncbi:hypothetical protein MNBD_GAMMA18-72 [hydrothermal vent metagenome]|uniref:Uncharacterized protein n=1 Tax=hydrothermal vent metagenome TaxID=652676 RepID=A0A3B0Z289_9ZZZZ
MCIGLKSFAKEVGIKFPISKHSGSQRKKIWNLERRFHCGVAGTCFTLVEMRRFCRKAQINTKGPVSDYELHTNFVTILGDSHAARPAAKYLDRKYKASQILASGLLPLRDVEKIKVPLLHRIFVRSV